MFHDESMQVVNKNRKSVSASPDHTQVHHDGVGRHLTAQSKTTSPVRLTDIVLYQSKDDLGVNFFMSNYVGEDPAVSQLYYLPSFYANQGYTSSALQHSIIAAGLAGFAKTVRRRSMADQATRSYLAAIRAINTALSDSKGVAETSTLMSIIMAAMFEIQINPRVSGMQNCTKHIAGAVAVARLVVKHEQPNEITRRVLTTLVQSTIINCWIQHEPLPPGFVELKRELNQKFDPRSVHGRFLDIILELVSFKQALQKKQYESPAAIVEQAKAIDDMLDDFAEDMPQKDRFDSIRIANPEVAPLAYEGYYHGVYLPYVKKSV